MFKKDVILGIQKYNNLNNASRNMDTFEDLYLGVNTECVNNSHFNVLKYELSDLFR